MGKFKVDYPLKNPCSIRTMSAILAFGRFYQGYCVGLFNPLSGPILKEVFNLDPVIDKELIDYYQGSFFAVFSIGAMVGVFSVGTLSNRFGRIPLMFLGEVLALGVALLYLVKDVRVMIFARFVSGVVSGLATIAGIILSEMLPKSMGGFGNALGYLASTSAMLTAFTTQNVLTKEQMVYHYRELLMSTVLLSFFRVSTLSWLIKTDTPKYLYLANPDPQDARYLIKDCYEKIFSSEHAEEATNLAMETFHEEGDSNKVSLNLVLSSNFRARLFSGMYLAFAQQMCGINFLIFYSTSIFDEISGSGKTITLVVGLSNMAGAFIAMYLIEKFGRKFDIALGSFMQAVSLFTLLYGIRYRIDWLMAISTSAYIIGFAVGYGGTYMAYLCEILPPVGVGIAMSLQWILTAAIGQFTPRLATIFGAERVLLGFAVICLFLFFGNSTLLLETKGKTEQEVVREFEKGSRAMFFNFR